MIDLDILFTPFGATPTEGQAPLEVQFFDTFPISLIIETSDESLMDAELTEVSDTVPYYNQEVVIEERSI